jgi:mono/diheme cytochrome c family protein
MPPADLRRRSPHRPSRRFPRWPALAAFLLAAFLFAVSCLPASAADHPGLAVYREHCLRCHGEAGVGTKAVPDPLVGERSVNQLTAYIDETMPEDDPTKVTGAAARQVAEYIHANFYSPVARDRNRPARVELTRLTVRQYENVAADLVAGFRGRGPSPDPRRGLRAEYFRGRDYNRQTGLVFERIDPQVDFDFGVEGPDPEMFEPNRFAIRWLGSILPPETGDYEFVIRSEQAVRLALNTAWYETPLIDASVKSGNETEYRATTRLLGGRSYPLRLEFSKANQGVDSKQHEYPAHASIQLLWKPPHGVLEPVPERCLSPLDSPEGFVLRTPFPPDDKSIGYERGTQVSPEWFAATTAAATEIADYLLEHVEHLANIKRDAADRDARLRTVAATFAERAFRRPLSADLRAAVVDRAFADAPDLDTGFKRSLLLTLESPRFLFRESPSGTDGFDTAARLSFGLWDSIPDQQLWDAAARGQLATPDQIRRQAERMVDDRRTRATLRDFLFAWLRVDLGPELAKDPTVAAGFSPAVAADLRTSLELFLDDCLWSGTPDFRRLFLADTIPLNGRLAPLYGANLPPDAGFTSVRLDEGRRVGLLGHPYLLSVLAYADTSSPIHRGVFLARSVLGNTLKPPQEAITPLAADVHPELTTRERVTLQTKGVVCQSCHMVINPLGFALEEFDAIGRYRTTERQGGGPMGKPIDAAGSYQPREGAAARFRGGRELAAYVAGSPDAQEAFVRNLFHALVKQPVRAWGPESLAALRAGFAAGGFDIRRLLVDIMSVASAPPKPPSAAAAETAQMRPQP